MSQTYDFERMSLQEFAALKQELERVIKRRFQRHIALVFTDVVGSTSYIEHHGDAAGRSLIERHHRLLNAALLPEGGRVVDTAGDGAFVVFPSVPAAAQALLLFQESIAQDNATMPERDALRVRTGLHWGAALVDREVVTGDAVHLAARISSAAAGGEIRVTAEAFARLPPRLRMRCTPQPAIQLKGYPVAVPSHLLDWRDPSKVPGRIFVRETGQRFPLPNKDIVSAGRLAIHNGRPANDIVLHHPQPALSGRISRWHFQLERVADRLQLRQLSRGRTLVDGVPVPQGQRADVRPGSELVVADVLHLQLEAVAPTADETRFATDTALPDSLPDALTES